MAALVSKGKVGGGSTRHVVSESGFALVNVFCASPITIARLAIVLLCGDIRGRWYILLFVMLVVHPASCCDVCLDPYSISSELASSPHAIACGHIFCLTCVHTPGQA
jgi:hypothetical protein